MKFDIFGIESGCIDLNINVDRIPERNGGTSVNEMSWQGGGKVCTGMVASARLGMRCAIAGAYGDDIFGRACMYDFERHGIDTANVVLRPGETSHFDVVVSEVESMTRTMLFKPGSAPYIREDEIDWSYLEESRALFITNMNDICRLAVKKAKASGKIVFIDADGYDDAIVAMMSDIDILVGSEFMFDGLYPGKKSLPLEAMEPFVRDTMARGPKTVLYTFGERGCIGIDESDEFFVQPAFTVDVKDTVGAGDVFHGAFIAAYLKGVGVREAARLSSAVSAIKCTAIGGRAGIPDEETLMKFAETGVIDTEEIQKRVQYYRRGIEHV